MGASLTVPEAINRLTCPDNKTAYAALQALEAWSEESDLVYAYLDRFTAMLESTNSYVRNRGLLLLGKNARWDREGKLDAVLDRMLEYLADPKPITVRQCLKALDGLVQGRPDLAFRVQARLEAVDCTRYPESMAPLIQRDILHLLQTINEFTAPGERGNPQKEIG